MGVCASWPRSAATETRQSSFCRTWIPEISSARRGTRSLRSMTVTRQGRRRFGQPATGEQRVISRRSRTMSFTSPAPKPGPSKCHRRRHVVVRRCEEASLAMMVHVELEVALSARPLLAFVAKTKGIENPRIGFFRGMHRAPRPSARKGRVIRAPQARPPRSLCLENVELAKISSPLFCVYSSSAFETGAIVFIKAVPVRHTAPGRKDMVWRSGL